MACCSFFLIPSCFPKALGQFLLFPPSPVFLLALPQLPGLSLDYEARGDPGKAEEQCRQQSGRPDLERDQARLQGPKPLRRFHGDQSGLQPTRALRQGPEHVRTNHLQGPGIHHDRQRLHAARPAAGDAQQGFTSV